MSSAISESGETIVLGAPGDFNFFTSAGSAFVYTGTGASWTLVKKVVASNPSDTAIMGYGSDTTDKYSLVGAPDTEIFGLNRGLAYIYVGDTLQSLTVEKL